MNILDRFRLDGSIALVTGCRRGIGRAMAGALAEAGADIIGVSRSLEPSGSDVEKEVAALGRKFQGYACDFSRRRDLYDFIRKVKGDFPRIDILINNAGTILRKPAAEHPDEVRRRIGFLPEEPPLYKEMTPDGYLRFVGRLKGMTAQQVDARLGKVCELTGIAEVRHQVIGTLSHGYRKRVGIAQAIVHEPQLLILDEPISGLDPQQIKEMRTMIRGLRGRHTILISSHILTEISQTCDRILMIDNGRIVASGSEDELVGQVATGEDLVLLLRGEQAALEALLTDLDSVDRFEVHGEAGGVIEVRVVLTGDVREELVGALVGAGFGLRGLRSAEQDLEQAFLSMIATGGRA